jgi:hypothetical protein
MQDQLVCEGQFFRVEDGFISMVPQGVPRKCTRTRDESLRNSAHTWSRHGIGWRKPSTMFVREAFSRARRRTLPRRRPRSVATKAIEKVTFIEAESPSKGDFPIRNMSSVASETPPTPPSTAKVMDSQHCDFAGVFADRNGHGIGGDNEDGEDDAPQAGESTRVK